MTLFVTHIVSYISLDISYTSVSETTGKAVALSSVAKKIFLSNSQAVKFSIILLLSCFSQISILFWLIIQTFCNYSNNSYVFFTTS